MLGARRCLAAALLVAAPAFAGCGGDDGDEDAFFEGTCDAVADMIEGFGEVQGDVQGLAGAQPQSLDEAQDLLDRVQAFFDDSIEVLDDTRDQIADLDGSAVDDGEDFVDAFGGALDDAIGKLRDAQDRFDLDAEDLAALDPDALAELQQLGDTLGDSVEDAFEPITDRQFDDLGERVSEVDRCEQLDV